MEGLIWGGDTVVNNMCGCVAGTRAVFLTPWGHIPPTFGHPSFLQVEMGPFKHTVDDGLDVRKAAFECMYSLLESCLGQLDICEFLNRVEDGLKDHYDIRVGRAPAGPTPPRVKGQPGDPGPLLVCPPLPTPGTP